MRATIPLVGEHGEAGAPIDSTPKGADTRRVVLDAVASVAGHEAAARVEETLISPSSTTEQSAKWRRRAPFGTGVNP